MSIKKLFESSDKSRNYLAETNEKNAFKDVESSKNIGQISLKQETFVPNIDYGVPENFAKFGSAYYYYSGALGRIVDYYPYDGSDFEQNEFYNKSLDVEKYIFNNLFPRTNGYANLDSSSYIDLKGGPHGVTYEKAAQLFDNPGDSKRHSANLYNKNIYQSAGLPDSYGTGSRESNLRANFNSGVTVEFWLKSRYLTAGKSEVIFDMWNNNASGSHDMGRFTVEIHSASTGTPFKFTVQSGSMTSGTPGSGTLFQQSIGQTVTSQTLSDWNHYAFTFQNSGSAFKTKFYLNGYLNHTVVNSDLAIGELPSKDMKARIGALITRPFRPDATTTHLPAANAHTLTGSVDEFRFWKAARNAKDIGDNWFSQVRGGTNTDISNTTLGVYYKFNEGTSGDSYLDGNVLDYSGRLTNGTWTGTPSRTLSSAITEASAAASEYKDPIIYASHPDVVNVRAGLLLSGSFHDKNNTSNLKTLIPSWVLEEHEALGNKNPELITHILGAYFDKIYNQIEALPNFKQLQYTSASATPIPFAQHLPQSLGLYTPQLFVDSDVISRFLNKTEDFAFEGDLTETKNLIYLNLYNNLTNIFKTKGTEKAIRNVFRCFHLDDSVINLRTYLDNNVYTLDNRLPRLKQVLVSKKALYFNTSSHINASCYQFQDPDDTTGTRGYISGSGVGGYENIYGFTAEVDVTLPSFDIDYDSVDRNFNQSSIYGMYTASTEAPATLTWPTYDSANFQVYVIREEKFSKNVFFMLSSSYYPNEPPGDTPWTNPNAGPFPILTSSVFFDAYDNTDWNLSVRLKPSNFPVTEVLSGSEVGYTYDLVFQGINTKLGTIENSFVLTASISKTAGHHFLSGSKRLYVGANRKNFTGIVNHPSDMRMFNAKYWGKYIDDDSLRQHVYDFDNSGISGSYKNISPLDPNNDGYDILNRNMLALDWNFSDVTASDGSGNFFTQDMSSGSAQERRAYGWAGGLSGYKHPGKGTGFKASSTSVSKDFNINTFKFIDPESPISSDMINILSADDKLFGFTETVPNFHHTLEKSMYAAISDEMLNFFAGVIDFNNVIGEPVNRYRERYKKLGKLREAFFRRVATTTDVEKYIKYYQWFDDSLSEIIGQLMPASGKFSEDVLNVVESHALERNKYKSQFPTIEFRLDDPITPALGINERLYNWKYNHAPISMSLDETSGSIPGVGGPLTGSELQQVNSNWWRDRAERQKSDISSGDNNIDAQRDIYRNTIENDNNQKLNTLVTLSDGVHSGSSYVLRKLARPYKLTAYRHASPVVPIRGGVNFEKHKKIDLTYNALRPAGPINTDGGNFIPENVLYASVWEGTSEDDITKFKDSSDPKYDPWFSFNPNRKRYRHAKVQFARDYEEGIGHKSVKSDISFPFNIVSSSVKTGYNKLVDDRVMSGVMITNLHNDVYGPDMESPMQGPFTNYAVGGHQSRHVRLNKLADSSTHPTGSISMNEIPDANDTVTINDGTGPITFTFKSSASDPEDIGISGNTEQTMVNLVNAINAYPGFRIRAVTTSAASASLTNFADYKVGSLNINSTGDWPMTILGMAGGSGGFNQWDSRPEAWKILLGKCDEPLLIGAIGMVGPDYPQANATESKIPVPPYPSTASQKAVYYRDFTAKRPVNIRNIHHTTGSTILGNYEHNYQVVQSHGGWSNPRQFIEKQPNLPTTMYENYSGQTGSSPTSVRTLLDIYRGARAGVSNTNTASALIDANGNPAHMDWSADYSTDYLQGGVSGAMGHHGGGLRGEGKQGGVSIVNNSVFVSKFSAPGGIEVMSRGYQDFRSGEFSVYNMLNNRNLTVKRPFQSQPGLSGSRASATVAMNKLPSNGDTITLPDGDTSRTFTFKNTVAGTTDIEIDGDTIDTMENFVNVVNSQRDFYIRGSTVNATGSFTNIKHYEKGNGSIGLTLTGDAWGYSITTFAGGTDGPEVDGIRVFDIHGNDYGHTIHASRHAARFFRDSVMRPTNQGATYAEAPSFHRVHRNNLPRPKIATENYILNFSDTGLDNQKQFDYGSIQLNTAFLATNQNSTFQKIERYLIPAITGAGGPGRSNASDGGSGFTWTGWVKFASKNSNTEERLWSIGLRTGNAPLISLDKRFNASSPLNYNILFKIDTNNGSGGTNEYVWNTYLDGGSAGEGISDLTSSFVHMALVWGTPEGTGHRAQPPPDGALQTANTGAVLYLNGISQSIRSFDLPRPDYQGGTGTRNNYRSFTGLTVSGNTYFQLGGGVDDSNDPISASIDEYTFWEVALDSGSVQEIYNSGAPCDITASSVYAASGTFLFDWIRLESVSQGTDSNYLAIDASNPGTYSNATNALRGYNTSSWIPMGISGSANNSLNPAAATAGCPPVFLGVSASTIYSCSNFYDNLNHYHQIPRGDRQYAWMTGAMADTDPCNYRYAGFMPIFGPQAGLWSSISASVHADYEPWLTMITASEMGSYLGGSGRVFGRTLGDTEARSDPGFVPTDFVGLNTHIYEPITSSTNTLGYPLNMKLNGPTSTFEGQYRNKSFIPYFINHNGVALNKGGLADGPMFNALMLKRNGPYGYSSHAMIQRNRNHPVLRNERSSSEISVITYAEHDLYDGDGVPTGEVKRNRNITNFTLPPVSMRGRPALFNFSSRATFDDCGEALLPPRESVTLKITDNNNKIFFNSDGLNTHTDIDEYDVITSLDYVLSVLDKADDAPGWVVADPNYLIYTENVFPSIRMEFVSSSRRRTNFNNLFWRDLATDRVDLGATMLDTMNHYVSQSAWPLDAQEDFLTRTASIFNTNHMPAGPLAGVYTNPTAKVIGKAGELQNNYSSFHFDPARALYRDGWWSYLSVGWQIRTMPLYARKQMFSGYHSVAASSGMLIPETGSITPNLVKASVFEMNPQFMNTVQTASGEALWEAGEHAGIVETVPLVEGLGIMKHTFKSYKSAPWYDNYQDFREQIRLLAKDYAIVPEYRIHNHVVELLMTGKMTSKYEIPGTGLISTTSSFFRDYINSEKLKFFKDTARKSSMTPKEFRITVSAVKKFNPYKGFYPAQRTLDLAGRFRKSYYESIECSFQKVTDATDLSTTVVQYGNLLNDITCVARPIFAPLFAPGLLYNSIKSGLAVDHPLLEATVAKPNMIASYLPTGSLSTTRALHAYAGFANSSLTSGSRITPSLDPATPDMTASSMIDSSSWDGGAFWDMRAPFETLLDPAATLLNLKLSDLEVSPSSSIPYTASLTSDGDSAYKLMARNFFGETANFYLNNGDFTALTSEVIPEEGIMFESGTMYGARIKLRRSVNGQRYYVNEYDSGGIRMKDNIDPGGIMNGHKTNLERQLSGAFGTLGARALQYNSGAAARGLKFYGREYPLPQDPAHYSASHETFTMYSRTTAFGPPVSGRHPGGGMDWGTGSATLHSKAMGALGYAIQQSTSGALDCFTGHNWSFTPPYYHGEAWCDVLFYPNETKRWKADEILSKVNTVYWRVDPGPNIIRRTKLAGHSLIEVPALITDHVNNSPSSSLLGGSTNYIGGGRNINGIAMQLSASLNLFGIERIPFQATNPGMPGAGILEQRNETNGMRWVIKPKWETPMLNFNSPIQAVTAESGSLTLPTNFGSGTVPRGMWHQFGIIDPEPRNGIFLEIGSIPEQWLANHYHVINEDSVYNKYNVGIVTDPNSRGNNIKNRMRSLSNVFGFNTAGRKRRLGQLAQTKKVNEAVVVIPYTAEMYDAPMETHPELVDDVDLKNQKQFFALDSEKLASAIAVNGMTGQGADLEAAGESIRKLITKMDKYILPIEFDFLRNPLSAPIVMYIFEFSQTFDRDDLSYMWQNLAPRNYKNIDFEEQSIAHVLDNSELLNAEDFIAGEVKKDIRFMAFKVKQKAVGDYYNHVLEQVGQNLGMITSKQFVGPNQFSGPNTQYLGLGAQAGNGGDQLPWPYLPGGSGGGTTSEDEAVPGGLQPATPAFQAYEAQYNWPYDYLSIVEAIKIDIDVLFDDESNRSKSLIQEGLTMPGFSGFGGLLDDDGPSLPETAASALELLGGPNAPTYVRLESGAGMPPTAPTEPLRPWPTS